jgi:hypothetical protein
MNYLLQTWYTPTLGIRLNAHDIHYVDSEYALHTKVQLCEETNKMHLDNCTVYEIKTKFALTNQIRLLALDIQLICGQYGSEAWLDLSYLTTILALVIRFTCSKWVPMGQIKYFIDWLVVLQTNSPKQGLETWIPPKDDIGMCALHMQRSWTKNAIWNLKSKNWNK